MWLSVCAHACQVLQEMLDMLHEHENQVHAARLEIIVIWLIGEHITPVTEYLDVVAWETEACRWLQWWRSWWACSRAPASWAGSARKHERRACFAQGVRFPAWRRQLHSCKSVEQSG